MYKFIGIGLLPLLVLIVIPFSSGNQSDDLGMYGMVTVTHKDQSGNILSESQIHNELVDQGTTYALSKTFRSNVAGFTSGDERKGICLTNEVGFAVDEGETFTSFNSGSTIDTGSFSRCIAVDFTAGANSATSGVVSFSAGTHFAADDTMTGIGICGVGSISGVPNTHLDCETSSIGTAAVLFGVININDVTPTTGDQIDVTYTVNLD